MPPPPARARADSRARRRALGPDGAPLPPPPPPPPRARSKLLQEPAQAGIWERPISGPPPTPTPAPVPGRSFGDDLRGLGVEAPQDDVAGVTGVASSSVVPYDANTGDTFPTPLPNADPELLRLRATYRLLTKAFGVLRYLFPVTGGLACWVAAGASLGGVFASLVPQMVNVVNVLAFALAAVMGGSVCLGAFLIVALVGRFLRNALFGTFFSESLASDAGRAPLEPYDYPTHPGLLAQARAQSEQETRYRAAQMALARQNELQYEEYQRRYESSRAPATAEPVYGPRTPGASEGPVGVVTANSEMGLPRVGGSWDDSDAYSPDASFDGSGGSRDEEEEEKEAFAAKAPPKRRRVDLPIETLMGLGGETLNAVGSEWQTQRQREAASAGTAAGAAAAPGTGGNRRNDGAPGRVGPRRRADAAAAASHSRPRSRRRLAVRRRLHAGHARRQGRLGPRRADADMGYGAPAPPPAPAAPAPAPPAKKNGGGWFGGFSAAAATEGAPAPAPPAPAPAPPPAEPGVDPVPRC